MATYGLRVWDASFNLMVDINTRLFRILDIIQITGDSSVTDPGLREGQYVWALLNNISGPFTVSYDPVTATLSWTGGTYPSWFLYGVR